MKAHIITLFFLCLAYLPLRADIGGDVNIVLQDLIVKYENSTTDEDKALLLHKIIIEYSYSDLNMSKAYVRELEKLAFSSDSPIPLVRYYNAKGVMNYVLKMELDSMLYWYNKASKSLSDNKVDDINLEVSLYNNKAVAYIISDLTDKAVKQYMLGIEILNKSEKKNYNLETVLYANIANMMNEAKRFDEALEYILKAEELNDTRESIEGKRSDQYEYVLSTKGEILYNLERYEEAEESLEAIVDNNNKLDITNNYGIIMLGKVYAKNGKIELARSTLNDGLKDAIALDIALDNKVLASLSIAKIELEAENPTSSLQQMDYIFSVYEKEGRTSDDPEVYETMAMVLEKSGRFEEALMYRKEHLKLVEQKIVKESNIKYGELKHQLSDIEKEYEINGLENEKKLQNSRMTMLVIAFILSLLLMTFIYFMYAKKEEHNQTLLRVNKEIIIAKDKALEAAKAKENFLATMSHEMRTPMNAVIGITNILLDEDPNPKHIEHLRNLKFSGNGLLNIINEVLDFSKIEANKLEIRKQEFNIHQFLDSMVNTIRHGTVNSRIKVFQDQQLSTLYHTVSGDEKRMCQILTNLLSNAVKFTDEGHIVLRSRIVEDNIQNITIKFQVEDSGVGIPSNKLESIFESFSQVNNEINRIHQGTGLGLAISKRLVELQGGKLEVESTEGLGTKFSFTIVFDKVKLIEKEPVIKVESKIFQSGIEGRRILLVEDNKLNQIVALKVLKKFKVETALAQNGQEAVDMVQAEMFDLILMDIHMPIMDGIEATKSIRALADNTKNNIPIVALSADAYSDKVKAATECGMNDYLSKPFKPQDLFNKIKSNLDTSWSLGA